MKFYRADKLKFDPRHQLSRIFVEGFYEWLKHFSKDKDKLTEAFAHIFMLSYFYVAAKGEVVAAMAACTQGFSPIRLERKEFVRTLGFIRGNFAHYMLRRHMIRNSYPFTLSKRTGSIEFVATSPDFRNLGIAHDLLDFVMEKNTYTSYVLEVADTNQTAFRLYEKLGFKEIKRVNAPNPKRNGVNFFMYMRRQMEGRD
ncbi:MAG: GNAT family N-acetyltransferase [Defluviitaleaceae bacterium]|nr:GNAT family N-acetyltransferase [Defluviitaleaceae bacterium]